MKVILLRDVAKLGKRFSVVEVPDGYALNKLVPQGMAAPATKENLKRIEAKNAAGAAHTAADEAKLKAVLEALSNTAISITAEANAQDHLFKTVKAADISAAAKAAGHNLPEEVIVNLPVIKALGTYGIEVEQGAVKGIINITVVRAA